MSRKKDETKIGKPNQSRQKGLGKSRKTKVHMVRERDEKQREGEYGGIPVCRAQKRQSKECRSSQKKGDSKLKDHK